VQVPECLEKRERYSIPHGTGKGGDSSRYAGKGSVLEKIRKDYSLKGDRNELRGECGQGEQEGQISRMWDILRRGERGRKPIPRGSGWVEADASHKTRKEMKEVRGKPFLDSFMRGAGSYLMEYQGQGKHAQKRAACSGGI